MLHGACLRTSERQMVLATTKTLKLSEMRGTLKRISCDTLAQTAADVKEEPIFKTLDAKNSDEESSSGEAFYGRIQKYRLSFSRKRIQNHYAQRGDSNHGKKFKSEGKKSKDNQGYVTTCRICGSRNHCARDCPDRPSENTQDAFLSFVKLAPSVLANTFGKAIVDTACTTTVFDHNWIKKCVSALTDEQRQLVQKHETGAKIMFGGGAMSKYLQRVSIPTCFGDLNCYLNVELTPGNLPLLLSVKSLKKTRAMIDAYKHTMIIPESATIDLEELASGHFAVVIFPRNSPTDSLQIITAEVLNETSLMKLHRQFGHCRPERLGGLLRSAGKLENWKMNLEKIKNPCQVCEKFGQPSRKPIVSMPHSKSFNETI